MERKFLVVACVLLGIFALACAQADGTVEAEIQKRHGKHKDYKSKDHHSHKDDDHYPSHHDDHHDYKSKEYKPKPSPPPPSPPAPPAYGDGLKPEYKPEYKKYDDDYYNDRPGPPKYDEYHDDEYYRSYKPSPKPSPSPKPYYYRDEYDDGYYRPYRPPSPSPPPPPPPPYYKYDNKYDYDYKPPRGDYPDDYGYGYSPKKVTPKDYKFDLAESSPARTPSNSDDEAVIGKTVVRTASLLGKIGDSRVVAGSVTWTGVTTLISSDVATQVQYLVSFTITQADWVGTLIAAGPGKSMFSSAAQTLPIIGGSGVFESATGTVTLTPGNPDNMYSFALTLWPHKKRDNKGVSIQSIHPGLPKME